MENNWLNLTKILMTEIVCHMKNENKYLMNLLEKGLLNLEIQKKRINHDNFFYKYKTETRNPEDFRNYQNLIDLLENLRKDNLEPKEELKKTNKLDIRSSGNKRKEFQI